MTEDHGPRRNWPLRADLDLAGRLFGELDAMSRDEPGNTRDAYGEGEEKAHRLVRRVAAELDLRVETDAAGNLYATLEGEDPGAPAWVVGSHLDTVPHGGNFDGGAGVVAAIAAVSALRKAGVRPRRPVTVIVTRAEESTWFPASYIGSRTALGLLPAALLDIRRVDTGRTLAEHMRELGHDPERVARGEAHLTPERVHGFVELHIEQGPILENENVPVGIVSAISGSFRYRDAACHGAYGHSGAVPRRNRQDAALATAELVLRLDDLWEEIDAGGEFVRITVGQFSTDPEQHAFSKVAGAVRFCIDVRSDDEAVLARAEARLAELVAAVETRRGVRFTLGPRTGSTPARMSGRLQADLGRIAREAGIGVLAMASGAGHDAAVFAEAGIASAMIFVRNQNGSHNPDEAMRMADFEAGALLLTRLVAD